LVNDEIYVGYEIGNKARIYSEADNVDRRPNKLKLWLRRRDNQTNSSEEITPKDSIETE